MLNKDERKPDVSVVIPYYNRTATLLRALESVRDQSFQNFEIITVDDGSQDGSFELAETFRLNHPNLKIRNLQQKNAGPSAARNTGVRAATGKYVAFLDSDDSWVQEKLVLQLNQMQAENDLVMVGTNYMVLLDDGRKRIAFPKQKEFLRANYHRMMMKVFFCMSSILVERSVFTEYGIWFREGKNQAEDVLFFLQVVRRFSAGRLHQPLTCYYKEMYGQEGLTADLGALLRNDIHNFKILATEPDYQGKRLNPALALLLMGYMYLKHVKRVLVTKRQKTQSCRAD